VIGTPENAAELRSLHHSSSLTSPLLRPLLARNACMEKEWLVLPHRDAMQEPHIFSSRDVGFAFAYPFSFPPFPFPLPFSATESCRRLRFHASLIAQHSAFTHNSQASSDLVSSLPPSLFWHLILWHNCRSSQPQSWSSKADSSSPP
jgi:hypothetical protein